MPTLPDDYAIHVTKIVEAARQVEGFLTDKEMRFLALLGACPTTEGSILEIGSFKGKSTVILAKGAALTGNPRISAVDPLTSPAKTDPSLKGQETCWDDFQNNLRRAGLVDNIDFHRTTSEDLAKSWDSPLRLLWIDGDHTYSGTRSDFENFVPYLADRAIIAMHDVLHGFDGPDRVFCEDILLSDHFGPCGIVGSIGWAQYFDDPEESMLYHRYKLKLYRRMSKIIPYVVFRYEMRGFRKLCYKIRRSLVSHGEVEPHAWLQTVA